MFCRYYDFLNHSHINLICARKSDIKRPKHWLSRSSVIEKNKLACLEWSGYISAYIRGRGYMSCIVIQYVQYISPTPWYRWLNILRWQMFSVLQGIFVNILTLKWITEDSEGKFSDSAQIHTFLLASISAINMTSQLRDGSAFPVIEWSVWILWGLRVGNCLEWICGMMISGSVDLEKKREMRSWEMRSI